MQQHTKLLSYPISVNTWYHVVATYNGSAINLYINGTLVRTQTQTGDVQDSTNNVQIGRYQASYLNGSLDDVMMLRRALSNSEVLALYNATANQYYNNFTNLSVGNYTFKAYAVNTAGNKTNTETRTITYSLDSTLPTVAIALPANTTYTTKTNLPLNYTATDNVAVDKCWYSLDSGANTTLTGYANTTFNVSTDGSHNIRVYANDTSNNVNSSIAYFSVDTTPPATVTTLANQSANTTWIYWNWTNPTDADFNSSIIYINGTNVANTSNNYYNATNLTANTTYTITIHTKDNTGNINTTDVNSTARTLVSCTENWTEHYTACNTSDNRTKYYTDENSCGTTINLPGDNGTTASCNYCSYNVTNTSWSGWQNQGSCLANDTRLQNRSRVEYDSNYSTCYAVTGLASDLWNSGNNNTYWDYQSVSCNYCSENITGPFNTSCNTSDNLTRYWVDANYATCCAITGLSSDCSINNGSYGNQTLSCDYCTPSWYEINTTCNTSDKITGWYNDSNRCYAQTGLASDNNPPVNNSYSCNYCSENITGPFETACSGNSKTIYYTDENYSTCCAVTSLVSDCHINNSSYSNTTQACGGGGGSRGGSGGFVSTCKENWLCIAWSACANDKQTRTCADSNKCNTTASKPAESRGCVVCGEYWICSDWGACVDYKEARLCKDVNECGTEATKPVEEQACGTPCEDGIQNQGEEGIDCGGPCEPCLAGEKLTGQTVSVAPYKPANPIYIIPTVLLLMVLVGIVSLRKTRLTPKMKKLVTALHISLVALIVLFIALTFVKHPSATGMIVKTVPAATSSISTTAASGMLLTAIMLIGIIYVTYIFRKRNHW